MASKPKPAVPSVASQRAHRAPAVTAHPRGEEATIIAPRSTPKHAAPSDGGGRHRRGPNADERARRHERISSASRDLAYQQALASRGPSKSVIAGAGKGAVSGAAAGAALGSVVPGVGTAIGAAAGAGVGAVGGGAGAAKEKKNAKALRQPWRRALVGMFAGSIVISALSPMTDRRRNEAPGRVIKQMLAIVGLFFVLGLISSAGQAAAKVAAALGGLVLLTLAVSERDLFTVIAKSLTSQANEVSEATA